MARSKSSSANSFLFSFGTVDKGYYDFRHQLLRDALYRSVPAAELRRLHARAGEFGTQLVGATEIHASVHFERAGLAPRPIGTASRRCQRGQRGLEPARGVRALRPGGRQRP